MWSKVRWGIPTAIVIFSGAVGIAGPLHDSKPASLAYRLTPGQPLCYRLVANIKAHMPFLDSPKPIDLEGALTVVYLASPKTLLADGTSDVELTVDSAELMLGSGKDRFPFPIPFEDIQKMLNQTVTITRLGEIKKVSGGGPPPFSISIPGIDPTRLYAMLFPVVFRPGPVKTGDRWTFKNDFLGGASAKPLFTVTVLPLGLGDTGASTRLEEKFSLPVDMKLDKDKKPITDGSSAHRTRKGIIGGSGKLIFNNADGCFRKSSFNIRADVTERLVGVPAIPDEPKEIVTAVKVEVSVDLLPAGPSNESSALVKKDKP
jgi:hypothetical protein